VTADNVTLKNFILKSPPTNADGYGIHTSGCNTVTFENLLVENSGRSGIDFIGCNNITLTDGNGKLKWLNMRR
jgi:polygalacturonase